MRRSQSLHQLRPVQSSRAPGRTASLDSLLETGGPDLRPLDRSGTQEALVRTCFLSRTDRKAASLPPSQKSPCGVLPENCHNVLQRGDAAQKDFTGIKENESQDSNQEHSGLEQHQDSTSTVREALPILTYDLHRKTCLLERDNEELRKKSKVSHEKLLLEDQGTRVVKAWIKKNENNLAKLEVHLGLKDILRQTENELDYGTEILVKATVDIETIQAVEKNILQNRELQEALASLLPRQLCPEEMGEAKAQQFIRQYEEAYGSRRELDEEDEEEEAAVAEDKEHESHRKEEEDTEEKKQEGKGEGKEENKDVLGVEEEGEKEGEKEEEKKKGEEEEEKGEEEDTGEEEEENGEDKGEKGEEKEDTDEEEGEKQGEMMATDVTEVREEERGEEDQNG
ncbi:high mobility group nucleosome-binding domain-containing protein 5-like isoform X2 [Lepisosteus oculatus]|uniref:high mobility group nucleosome-binding domain-containing protein 5-like isoform X2 n=1 Tax=Lepisosteus oculatus TaxID=7918 RepID=UPI0035F5262E